MTPGHEVRALDPINHSKLWMTRMTQGRKLRALDVRNSLGLWMT